MHVAPEGKTQVFPEGTHDPWSGIRGFTYTGSLRAVYPESMPPKRVVPAHIGRPDYADNVKGESFGEKAERKRQSISLQMAQRKGQPLNKVLMGKQLTEEEQAGMRKVSILAREVLEIAAAALRPGITTLELDELVHNECVKRNAYPSPLNYSRFPRSVCTSINEVICHGIPDARQLEDGDIINLDVTLFHGGFHADLNATYPVGTVAQENLDVIACSRECLDEAIRICKPGVEFREVGAVIEAVSDKWGFKTNKTFVGHGVNQLFHPPPDIPHYRTTSFPGRMHVGQAFTIEPMICVGNAHDVHWPDNWTAATKDGKPSAQFEETLLITENGVEVLTAAPSWSLPPKRRGKRRAEAPAVGDGDEWEEEEGEGRAVVTTPYENGVVRAGLAGAGGVGGEAAKKKKNKKKKKAKKAAEAGEAGVGPAEGAEDEAEGDEE
ncbi:hypothetical protein JCM8097_005522 [Rhodosporidiobolus ruineniae]